MNKTEAKFSTSSEGIAAYLLWNSIYPDRIAELTPGTTLLYFQDKDYSSLMLKYWKGVKIPMCEVNECLVTAKRIFKSNSIDTDWFFDMWDEILDMREDYKESLKQ